MAGAVGTVTITLVLALAILPHNAIVVFSLYRQLTLLFLGVVCSALLIAERHRRNKAIAGMFVLLGVQQLVDIGYYFVPQVFFPQERFAGFFYFQYVSAGMGLIIQSTCIVGAALFMNTTIGLMRGLVLTVVPIVVFLLAGFHPILQNPRYLYTTPDVTDFRIVDRAWVELFRESGSEPSAEAVAERIGLSRWDGLKRVGELTHKEKTMRVMELEPYLFGDNYHLLIFKPLNAAWSTASLAGSVVLLGFILFWFIGESPRGVYFDRITILLLCFSVFEAFHFSVYAELKEHTAYLRYFNIGAFLSLFTVVGLIVLFLLRLRFVLSLEGQYYESRLNGDSIRISRWRDSMDDYIIRRFFNANPYKNRFLTRDSSTALNPFRKKSEFLRKKT
ncbi:MAG: hypothetical protein HY563_08705 [Ignavibacteriales bacterium]|nr:hypothetical protein [Ignavibacteriales bacterium]